MYVRVTSFKVDPARLADLQSKIKETAPAAKALPGVIDIYAAWRADGQGVVTSVYDAKHRQIPQPARSKPSGARSAACCPAHPRPSCTTASNTSLAKRQLKLRLSPATARGFL
jgi:hypothetical protein